MNRVCSLNVAIKNSLSYYFLNCYNIVEFHLVKGEPSSINKRFKIAHREAWIGLFLAIFNFLWWYGFAYGLGSSSPEEYSFILGFPAWFFWSCIAGFIVMVILVILVVKFVLKDMPLDEMGGEGAK